MTIKEAMEKIEAMREEIRWVFPMDFSEALDMALTALRKALEDGTPLTLEELREMVGQWVWVVVQYEHCECTGWAFIPTPAYIAYLDQTISTDLCGRKFKAYRRQPEEGAP